MLNFGLWDLRIVNPFCDHLTDMARARASGADAILENARVFEDIGSAVADLAEVVGTSARQRDMTIRVVSPEQAGGMAIRCVHTSGDGREAMETLVMGPNAIAATHMSPLGRTWTLVSVLGGQVVVLKSPRFHRTTHSSMESFLAGGARLGLMFGSERNG